jgi:GH15 family glucan-1,4-alpha-glucosidase
MPRRIEDYAMIGTAAPRRSSAATARSTGCAAALRFRGLFCARCWAQGQWPLADRPAAEEIQSDRRYRGDSLILETLSPPDRQGRVTDFMPPGTPKAAIVRIVECLQGQVDMRTELAIRFDYGVTIPWVTRRDRRTLTAVAGPHLLTFRTPADVRGENMHSVAGSRCSKGESHALCAGLWRVLRPLPQSMDAFIALEETERYWRKWPNICKVQGAWRSAIMRSLLTLKGLSYAPTGGIVAAVTTSLPEKIGGTATGIIAIAGCATPPSSCLPSSMPAIPKKPRCGRNG